MNSELIAMNVRWLRQVLQLIGGLDDRAYASAPGALPRHRVGSHLRHVLEFYECFLDGLESARVDYDARRRDETIEKSRAAAAERIASLIRRLQKISFTIADQIVLVRKEDDSDSNHGAHWLSSSIARELQALSSHTIHHFALMSVTLTLHGIELDPEFGMSPSTLRFMAEAA